MPDECLPPPWDDYVRRMDILVQYFPPGSARNTRAFGTSLRKINEETLVFWETDCEEVLKQVMKENANSVFVLPRKPT